MNWYRVVRFELTENLQELNSWLDQQQVAHRFTEEEGAQWLWVAGEDNAQKLMQMFEQNPQWFRSVASSPEQNDLIAPATQVDITSQALGLLMCAPLTVALIAGGILGALLLNFDNQLQWVRLLTSQDFTVAGNTVVFSSLQQAMSEGQYWRLISPIFLHFGAMHIIFNGLWIWEFGRRAEAALGQGYYLSLILMLALCSNLFQYIWQGPSLFGGLSGVVYGLMGFVWMRQRFYPGSIQPVMTAIIGFMLIYLVVGMLGLIDLFIPGSVANIAHLAGLIAGVIFGIAPIGVSKPAASDDR